jgi:transglutaminase-like putative cysteine protease
MPFPVAFQKFLLVVFLSLCLFAQVSRAEEDDEEQTDRSASRSFVSHVVIHPDLSATIEERFSVKLLRESAIESEGQQELRYQVSVDPVEILEAFTEKADGRRIDVDWVNILTRDTSSGIARVYERDAKAITIVYPDVDAGDRVVYRSRTRQAKSRLSGHFYKAWLIPRSDSYEEFRVTVDLPAGLRLKAKVRGPGIIERIEEDGRRLIFTYQPGEWTPEESGAVSILDREPAIFLTTFNSFEEVAAGYSGLDAGKAIVSPEIKTLAESITEGIPERRRQAEAVSNWVRKNIRYALVTMGSEGNIPNPAPTILKNRYGDCKDHMILTTALLAAKSITSERVAINLGEAFQLTPLPMPMFNHAILYLPEFDLYDDPTDSQSSFGILQTGEYDKPVLRYSEASARLAHAADENRRKYGCRKNSPICSSGRIRQRADGPDVDRGLCRIRQEIGRGYAAAGARKVRRAHTQAPEQPGPGQV